MAVPFFGAVIAEVAEAIVGTGFAVESMATAAGITEGGAMAAATGASSFEAGMATAEGVGTMSMIGGAVSDPATAGVAYGMRALAPETMEVVGAYGGNIGEGIAMRAYGSDAFWAQGFGRAAGSATARGVVAGIPARLTVAEARRGYAAFSRAMAERGIPNPYADWQDFRDHHHSGFGPFSGGPGRKKKIKQIGLIQPETMPAATFPKKKKMTMRWSCRDKVEVTSAAAAGGQHASTLKLNSIVNPGASFNYLTDSNAPHAHEPLGYSQMSAIYDQYVVSDVRVRVDYFINERANQGTDGDLYAMIIGCAPLDNNSEKTYVGHYEELDLAQWVAASPESVGRLSFSISPSKFFGIPKSQQLSDNTLRAGFGADPTNMMYLHTFAHLIDQNIGISPNVQVSLNYTVEYDVVWMEPKALAQSGLT